MRSSSASLLKHSLPRSGRNAVALGRLQRTQFNGRRHAMLTGTLRSSLLISPSHMSMFYIVVLLRLEVVVPRNRRQLVTCPEVASIVLH